jgi:hypothetical protein
MLNISITHRGPALQKEIQDRLAACRTLRTAARAAASHSAWQAILSALGYHQHCLVLVRAARRRRCLECGAITTGSIGQAGIFWPCLCQSCKDRADGALRSTIRYQAEAHRAIESALLGVSVSS